MSSFDPDEMYALLPSIVRQKDQLQGGGVLQALVGVIAQQAQVISAALDQQYDDQFIETCAPWVVPYIGDLIGFTPLRPPGPGQPSATRAEVADTIGSRRRKGTVAMLEQLCVDVTGWPGMAVEFFSRIATTQYVRNHLRPENATVDVHSPMTAVDIGGAFDLPPRTVDVRRIDTGRGRYNVPDIGLFVWRLAWYSVSDHPVGQVGANQYTFDPFGGSIPLVNPPAEAAGEFDLLDRPNLPFFLQYYPMYAGLLDYSAPAPVGVSVNGIAYEASAVGWCNLSTWTAPTTPGIAVAVDPELGRLVFATPPAADDAVTVSFTYAFSGDYGGGAYDYPVPADETAVEAALTTTTVPAFADVGDQLASASHEVVEILDSGIWAGDLALAPASNLLVITAADQQRPVLTGSLSMTAVPGAQVTLRGLGVGGSLSVTGEGPLTLRLEHCTIRGGVDWSDASVAGALYLDHTLCGAIAANPAVDVSIADSAVDAGSDSAAALSGGAGAVAGSITITTSTVLGTVSAVTIPLLSESIVTGPVVSTEVQAGCLRYSFVPLTGSQTPRRFRCQPDLEISSEVAAALAANPALTAAQQEQIQASVQAWLAPVFTSREPGTPGYLQLADAAPNQISSGAEAGDEMGVFYGLFSGRRDGNLSYRVNEYLRLGLQAGIIHVT
jgi:hypothetical protein